MGGSGFNHGRIIWLKRILSSSLFRFSLGFAVSCLTLYLALREVSLYDLGEVFSHSDLLLVGLAFANVAVNILLKIVRWRALLNSSGTKVGFTKVSMSFLAAQMLNTFLPARVGEISRVYVLGRYGIDHAFVLGTIAVEMVLNLIAYTLLFILLLLMIPLPGWIGASSFTLISSVLFILSMVLVTVFYRDRIYEILERLVACLPEKYQPFLLRHLRLGLSSLDVLTNRTVMIKLAIVTALIWGTAVLTNQLVFLSLDIDLPMTASILILIALQIGISIPSLPGKLGIFEYVCILVLGVFGVGQALALTYGILLHVIVYLPIVVSGFLSYLLLDTKISKGTVTSITE